MCTKLYLFQCILHRMPPELSLSQEYKCIFGYETLEFIFRLHTNFHLNIIVYYFLFSTWVEIGSQQDHKNVAISRASSFIYCTFCDGRLHIRMFLFTTVSKNFTSMLLKLLLKTKESRNLFWLWIPKFWRLPLSSESFLSTLQKVIFFLQAANISSCWL